MIPNCVFLLGGLIFVTPVLTLDCFDTDSNSSWKCATNEISCLQITAATGNPKRFCANQGDLTHYGLRESGTLALNKCKILTERDEVGTTRKIHVCACATDNCNSNCTCPTIGIKCHDDDYKEIYPQETDSVYCSEKGNTYVACLEIRSSKIRKSMRNTSRFVFKGIIKGQLYDGRI